MAWEILTSTEYPAILATLDTKLTDADIPDSLLDQTIYKAAAIQDVVDIYPAAASETVVANQVRITRAAIYFCAARLAPAAIRITSLNVSTRDMSFSRQVFDPVKRAAELRAMAQDELAEILTPSDETPSMPTMFTVARGYRGR
jgi:hypothetical protein